MNINQMMKQAQQMQANIERAQQKADALEFERVFNQAITIKVNGKKEILSLSIDEDILEADNKEMLEDMLLSGLNDLFNEVDEEVGKIMSAAAPNMKLPGF